MDKAYITLTGEPIDLSALTPAEKAFLGEVAKAYSGGEAYPNFVNRVNAPGSPVLGGGQWVTSDVAASPLYRVCEDLSDRLGIAQGFLAKGANSSVEGTGFVDRGYISCEDASALTGLSAEAIRKAIRQNRLPARKVARVYVLEPQAVEAYAARSKRAQAARGPVKQAAGASRPKKAGGKAHRPVKA